MKVLEAVCEYRGGRPACAWVRTIVAHCAIDDIRRKQNAGLQQEMAQREFERLENPSRSPEALAAEKELIEMLSAMISALPETYRQILDLRYAQGLSTREAADRLHISRTNVSVRLSRAVSMLRKRLEARGGN